MYRRQRDKPKETEPNTMFNKVILIGRLGQNAEAKTAQNNREYVVLNIATQESWKNDKGDYETRTEWHRVFAWRSLSKFAKTLQKGQLITLEGTLRYREVEDEVKGTTFKHRIAEVHATSMKQLSKIEAADDPSDAVKIAALLGLHHCINRESFPAVWAFSRTDLGCPAKNGCSWRVVSGRFQRTLACRLHGSSLAIA
jgi:single-strand DNA-binding protein